MRTLLLSFCFAAVAHAVVADTQVASTNEDAWKAQFKPRSGTVPQEVPAKVKQSVTYTLQRAKEPTDEEADMYKKIADGMDRAVKCYNENSTGIRAHVNVVYSPGTPTADGSSNGTIRLGKTSYNQRVCMHEIAHTLGVGTSPQWGKLVSNGIFTGSRATKVLQEITKDPAAVLHADRQHFWPFGLNYDNEVKSNSDFANHCKIVSAICEDLKRAK